MSRFVLWVCGRTAISSGRGLSSAQLFVFGRGYNANGGPADTLAQERETMELNGRAYRRMEYAGGLATAQLGCRRESERLFVAGGQRFRHGQRPISHPCQV